MGWRETWQARGGHPGFVDMTGQVLGTWRVLGRLANAGGNACWKCQCTVCGTTRSLPGIRLRANPRRRCYGCRPKKRGQRAA